jgi:gliding motility-associated-like protein
VIYQGADPTVSFNANPNTGVLPLPVGFTNTSDPGFSSYQWSFGDGNIATTTNASNTYYIAGTYTVQLIGLTPNNTCNDTADVVVIVFPPSELVIPNVFSPNGDGINEFFVVDSKGLKDIYIEIFDRWGLKLHTIDGPKGYWDGNGAPEGTYYFLLRAEGYDGKVFEKQGYLLLVR